MDTIIPKPVSVAPSGGTFTIRAGTHIKIEPDSDALRAVGLYLIDKLKPATGYDLKMAMADTFVSTQHTILLTTKGASAALGEEGYVLTVTADRVVLSANTAAGLFYGVQTIFQMLPATVLCATVRPGPWPIYYP